MAIYAIFFGEINFCTIHVLCKIFLVFHDLTFGRLWDHTCGRVKTTFVEDWRTILVAERQTTLVADWKTTLVVDWGTTQVWQSGDNTCPRVVDHT